MRDQTQGIRRVGRPRSEGLPLKIRVSVEVADLIREQAPLYGLAPSAYASLVLSEAIMTSAAAQAASETLRRAKHETT